MWYKTKEEAEKAKIYKENKFNLEFVVLEDFEYENVWWTIRKEAVKFSVRYI